MTPEALTLQIARADWPIDARRIDKAGQCVSRDPPGCLCADLSIPCVVCCIKQVQQRIGDTGRAMRVADEGATTHLVEAWGSNPENPVIWSVLRSLHQKLAGLLSVCEMDAIARGIPEEQMEAQPAGCPIEQIG